MKPRPIKSIPFLLIAAILLSIIPANVRAESGMYRNYAKGGIGINDFTDDMDDTGYDENFSGSLAYGRYLADYLAVEGGINFFQSDHDDVHRRTGEDGDRWENTIFVTSLSATLKGEIPMGPVRLYGGVGVASYFIFLHTDHRDSHWDHDDDDWDRHHDDEEDEDVVFGVHALAGISCEITSRFFMGIEGCYRWTDDMKLWNRYDNQTEKIEGDLDGYMVNLTFGFRF